MENTSAATVLTLILLIAEQEKMQLLLLSAGFLSPLDRCIVRLVLKKKEDKNHMHLSGVLQIAQCIPHSSFITTDLLHTLGSELN